MIDYQANASKCIIACQDSLRKNEYNMRRVKGINMSHSDVETSLLYAETILREGTYEFSLMRPRGAVAELLKEFKLLKEE